MLNQIGNSDLRMLDHFQMGPNLVRGFAPNGIGPRDINPYRHRRLAGRHQILGRFGGTADAVLVPAEGSRPQGLGLCRCRRAVRLQGTDVLGPYQRNQWPGCIPGTTIPLTAGTCTGLVYDNGNVVRTSVGVGLIWQSPFGPLRFDYAVPLTKGQFDRVQQFKFGGGTSF